MDMTAGNGLQHSGIGVLAVVISVGLGWLFGGVRGKSFASWARKHWLRITIYGGLAACLAEGLIEPYWVKVNRLSLGKNSSLRIVHISDIHYKGNRGRLAKIVNTVNSLSADIVCFTGDIVENTHYLAEALEILSGIKAPLYGVPGNHEYWSGASFTQLEECFKKTGGAWLEDGSTPALDGKLLIVGKAETHPRLADTGANTNSGGCKRILLCHYPALVDSIKGESYTLILAGHAHGGQVRLPFVGALVVPFGVDGYQMGTYATPAGPLHVSAGLGTFFLPIRFFCRPEITVIDL